MRPGGGGKKRREKKKKTAGIRSNAEVTKTSGRAKGNPSTFPISRKIRSTRTGVPQREIRRGASHAAPPVIRLLGGCGRGKVSSSKQEPCFPEKEK